MKKYLISILVLLIIGCGIYLWANSISQDERLELLYGDYELIDWQIRSKSAIPADSLTIYDIPLRGEHFTLQTNDDGITITIPATVSRFGVAAALYSAHLAGMAASCDWSISCRRTIRNGLLASNARQSNGCRHHVATLRPDE